ncbi:YeeE/YedE family protein [Sulfuricystis multivorans]|uniref:YeeE/YedE family protein n=1 Tax=Sulfuricystis multivorans TaxID=2211108 RepID=UPI0024E0231E|nr:YeeE/YedE family protein [Sulfuricystis multivorans]
MEFTIHHQVLLVAFVLATALGMLANKTNFCTMGAVSDWVNMGDTGRLRAWLLAGAVAMLGVVALEAMGKLNLASGTFPPYRTAQFAWLRYLLGGFMFGIGMTLASGCGNKTAVRIGAGNLKSLVVLVIAALCAYAMLWTNFYNDAFGRWIAPTTIDLAARGFKSQTLGDLTGLGNTIAGLIVALALIAFAFAARDFRTNRDNVLAGIGIGLIVIAGWYVTGGPMGAEWKEWADFADTKPLRVETQSFTFISPMGDAARYLMNPRDFSLINFGIVALFGVIFGSFLWAMLSRGFRIEWFVSVGDFLNHAIGAVLMGIGGVLSMGCTIGQGITGVSTLALGSILTLVAIIAGAAATMKFQYWRMMREA